jgi:hypothetical protein
MIPEPARDQAEQAAARQQQWRDGLQDALARIEDRLASIDRSLDRVVAAVEKLAVAPDGDLLKAVLQQGKRG